MNKTEFLSLKKKNRQPKKKHKYTNTAKQKTKLTTPPKIGISTVCYQHTCKLSAMKSARRRAHAQRQPEQRTHTHTIAKQKNKLPNPPKWGAAPCATNPLSAANTMLSRTGTDRQTQTKQIYINTPNSDQLRVPPTHAQHAESH